MKKQNKVSVSNYFQDHVREAIGINEKLRPLYKDLSDGKTERIFRFLINAERLTLPLAYLYDRRSYTYQRTGILLFAREFMPMHLPEIKRRDPLTHERVMIDWKDTWKKLKQSLREDDLYSFKKIALEDIRKLQGSPEYSILVRHLLESVYRCAYFLQDHEAEAMKLNLPSPKKLVYELISFQLWGLPGMALLDDWCEPLQSEGIPLFWDELPDLMKDLES